MTSPSEHAPKDREGRARHASDLNATREARRRKARRRKAADRVITQNAAHSEQYLSGRDQSMPFNTAQGGTDTEAFAAKHREWLQYPLLLALTMLVALSGLLAVRSLLDSNGWGFRANLLEQILATDLLAVGGIVLVVALVSVVAYRAERRQATQHQELRQRFEQDYPDFFRERQQQRHAALRT